MLWVQEIICSMRLVTQYPAISMLFQFHNTMFRLTKIDTDDQMSLKHTTHHKYHVQIIDVDDTLTLEDNYRILLLNISLQPVSS